ncbi:MAG: hypothetical protein ACREQL_09365 [Candidatus Binatia bacterium]
MSRPPSYHGEFDVTLLPTDTIVDVRRKVADALDDLRDSIVRYLDSPEGVAEWER